MDHKWCVSMLLVKCCATNSSFIKKNKITTAQTFCSFIIIPKFPQSADFELHSSNFYCRFITWIVWCSPVFLLFFPTEVNFSDIVYCKTVCVRCVTCCLLFKFCMASPGLPCPRPCPGRLLLARGSFRLGEGRNGDGEVSSDRTPSWSRAKWMVDKDKNIRE